jgi:hypothetical protein
MTARNPGLILPKCNHDVYVNGDVVIVIGDGAAEDIEDWVKKVAERSGQQVDWHYVGGRAVVKALGDLEEVDRVIYKEGLVKEMGCAPMYGYSPGQKNHWTNKK